MVILKPSAPDPISSAGGVERFKQKEILLLHFLLLQHKLQPFEALKRTMKIILMAVSFITGSLKMQ